MKNITISKRWSIYKWAQCQWDSIDLVNGYGVILSPEMRWFQILDRKVGWAMKNEELRVCRREIMLLASSWGWWRLFGLRSYLNSVEVMPSFRWFSKESFTELKHGIFHSYVKLGIGLCSVSRFLPMLNMAPFTNDILFAIWRRVYFRCTAFKFFRCFLAHFWWWNTWKIHHGPGSKCLDYHPIYHTHNLI